jgi:hypothetical protein
MTPEANRSAASASKEFLRFKWAAFSAVIVFSALYGIDGWFGRHGWRRELTFLDNFLLAGVVFVLAVTQQIRHERELQRHRKIIETIAETNHHTRNALQVIVNRSAQTIADSGAIEGIRQAVNRIDWCLREVLPHAGEPISGKRPVTTAGPPKRPARSQAKSG